jgi:hypothetical protein
MSRQERSRKLLEASRAYSAGMEGSAVSRKLLEASRASSAGLKGAAVSRKMLEALRASSAGWEGAVAGRRGPGSCWQLHEHPQQGGKEQEQAGEVQEVAKSFKSILSRVGRRRSRQEQSRKLLESSTASSAVRE